MTAELSLGDRMKLYERESKSMLDADQPIIVRIDGKAFHTFTKAFDRPFDENIIGAMGYASRSLIDNIPSLLAYTQSDEITLVLSGYSNENSQPWFNGNLQKIVSVAASITTAAFNDYLRFNNNGKIAYFDARAFNVPSEDEIINNLIWRQRDAIKNSVSSWARNFFSDRELHGKNTQERIDMIKESEPSYDWNSLRDGIKYGLIAYKKPYVKVVDGSEVTRTTTEAHAAPIISENKEFIYNLLEENADS